MSEGYCIELAEEQIGVVVREKGERHFTFFTAVKAFNALDGRQFRGPLDAERAARAHAAQRKKNSPATGNTHRRQVSSSAECIWSALAGL
jgi:hypothetical protein